MLDPAKRPAIIYARVSDAKQKIRGDGLGSQETRCREFASFRKLAIVEVFKEDFTGATDKRPAMKSALAWLRRNKALEPVIIIDDLSRLARDVVAFRKLRSDITAAGGTLESPSIVFREDSDSLFVENVLASAAQHQRQKNAEQTRNRMRARTMNGYWVFQAPVGYKYEKVAGHGKLLVRNEPLASIVAEALEGYASGRFQTQAEVMRWLETRSEFPRDASATVRNQRVNDLLNRVVYAGYIDLPEWKVTLVPAKHEPLVSYATYQAVQERLHAKAKVPARADLNEDFPLRGFVVCDCCETPLTACWSTGSHAKHPYYLCHKRGCEMYGKSIRRNVIESEFAELLESMRPAEDLIRLADACFRDIWNARLAGSKDRAKSLEAETRKIDHDIGQLMDRIVAADSDALISAYERRVRALEEQRVKLRENAADCGRPIADYDATLRTAVQFLANPCNLWNSPRLEDKRAVLKLTFVERLAYRKNAGFRTPLTSSPFRLLSGSEGVNEMMAPPRGLEPPTCGLGNRRSIRLSYGGMRAGRR